MNQTGWNSPVSQFTHVKILLLKMVDGWNPNFFNLEKHRFHILHFPNSTRLFTKPTSRHYTKYRFCPDIGMDGNSNTRGVDTCPMRMRRDPPPPPLNVSPGSRSAGPWSMSSKEAQEFIAHKVLEIKRELKGAALNAVEMQLIRSMQLIMKLTSFLWTAWLQEIKER